VLSADEVVRFLEAIPSLKSRTALTTVYAAGLRVSEVVLLKIADNDSQRMVIRVEQGKGGKDRCVMLSPQLLRILRTYWRLARPKRWLFPGRDDERPLVPTSCTPPAAWSWACRARRAGDRARGRPACRRSRCRRHSRVQSSTTTRMRRSGR
jgi:integrase